MQHVGRSRSYRVPTGSASWRARKLTARLQLQTQRETTRTSEERARATVRSTDDVSYRTKWESRAGDALSSLGFSPPPVLSDPSDPLSPCPSTRSLVPLTPSPRFHHYHPSLFPVLPIRYGRLCRFARLSLSSLVLYMYIIRSPFIFLPPSLAVPPRLPSLLPALPSLSLSLTG